MDQNFHRLCTPRVLVPISEWPTVMIRYQNLRDRMVLRVQTHGYTTFRADGVLPFDDDDKAGRIPVIPVECRCFMHNK